MMKKHWITSLLVLLGLLANGPAGATTSTVMLNVEPNPTCKSLADNQAILEARDNAPPTTLGTWKEIIGQDGQKMKYNLGPSTRAQLQHWEIVSPATPKPINFVILKAQGSTSAKVIYYSSITGGANSDDALPANGTITAVSFCYGLSPYVPPPSSTLPDCDSLNTSGGLDSTGIQCPTNGGERVLISLDPNAANWGVTACSCNHTFTTCNPDLAAGQTGACTKPLDTLEHLPVIIEAIEDPTYCTTIGGTRTCKTY